MNLGNLEQKQIELIKDTYQRFEYYADNASTQYKKARKFFAYDRKLNARELDLIVLNYLHLYETSWKNRPFVECVGMDPGLYELISIYERVKGMSNAKEFFAEKLPIIAALYQVAQLQNN